MQDNFGILGNDNSFKEKAYDVCEFVLDAFSLKETFMEIVKKFKYLNASLIEESFDFAAKAHSGQKRLDGSEFIVHPVSVALILINMRLDTETICAALLHDVVEDTNCTIVDVKNVFGKNISDLVKGVTKLNKIFYVSGNVRQVENFRRMFFAIAKDVRVIILKLADRLHNMKTVCFHEDKKKRLICQETLDIYASFASIFGLFNIKWELEDLAFRGLEPIKYHEILVGVSQKRAEREKYIKNILLALKVELKKENIKAVVEGRPKHFYSIYKKMLAGRSIEEIYDLFGVRIIVDSVKDCYISLWIAHKKFKPIFGRIKDYIAIPKSNMYQSLHTSVIDSNGYVVEVQIRTVDMHEKALNGIASHWKYKTCSSENAANFKDNYFDVYDKLYKRFSGTYRRLKVSEEMLSLLKIDIFDDKVYVFSPIGEVLEFPKRSTVLDYAYFVHSYIGNKFSEAKVNGISVTINYEIRNGDVVLIITDKDSDGPKYDWINYVVTVNAKTKIKEYFKKKNNFFKEEKLDYVSNDKGYRKQSISINNAKENNKKYKFVRIGSDLSFKFRVKFILTANDEAFLFKKIIELIENKGFFVKNLNSMIIDSNIARINLTVDFFELFQIEETIKSLRSIKGIFSIITSY
ncbi:MAG: RelA/SpoT family protein [Clostridiales bacterium]|jgi:GTP pyrophosphokinase|nr:RelA/SpoT family protein [Clostridiales bacterium]